MLTPSVSLFLYIFILFAKARPRQGRWKLRDTVHSIPCRALVANSVISVFRYSSKRLNV